MLRLIIGQADQHDHLQLCTKLHKALPTNISLTV